MNEVRIHFYTFQVECGKYIIENDIYFLTKLFVNQNSYIKNNKHTYILDIQIVIELCNKYILQWNYA